MKKRYILLIYLGLCIIGWGSWKYTQNHYIFTPQLTYTTYPYYNRERPVLSEMGEDEQDEILNLTWDTTQPLSVVYEVTHYNTPQWLNRQQRGFVFHSFLIGRTVFVGGEVTTDEVAWGVENAMNTLVDLKMQYTRLYNTDDRTQSQEFKELDTQLRVKGAQVMTYLSLLYEEVASDCELTPLAYDYLKISEELLSQIYQGYWGLYKQWEEGALPHS